MFRSPGRAKEQRPVLVLTRNSAISYLSTVTVAPITSTIRGVPSEVALHEEDGMKSPCAVNRGERVVLRHRLTMHRQRCPSLTRIVIPNEVRDLQFAASHHDAGTVPHA
ncbi:MAG: type II toxin-antitoxin system PemK/MazF family toxin [Terriglobales bacterium]